MKKIANRAWALLVILAVLLAGVGLFCVRYAQDAHEWVVFPGSPHLYTNGNLDCGVVTDADGTLLLAQTDGEKRYADDAALRRATLHLLGDRSGYISAPLLSAYADRMVGFDPVRGLFGAEEGGSTMALTIRAAAQTAALEALDGRAGCVGVMNYRTGELLCAVSAPTYDADNVPDIAGDTTGAYEGVYVNRLTQATFVPGSIFKLLTTAAALETFDAPEEKTYLCEGTCVIGDQVITCEGVHGWIDLQTALAKSCNCAFGQAAVELGGDTLTRFAQQAGIGRSLSFDGIRTAKGSFDVSDASAPELAWAGIGQHTDLINPCQYLEFVAAIANGGAGVTPHLVKSVTGADGMLLYEAETAQAGRVMQAETAATLGAWMRNNVQTIYGDAQFGGLSVCAKSGTAEVGSGAMPHATFTGFVQDEAYPLAFIVVAENAGAGSDVSAPIAARVLQACVQAMQDE